MIDSLGDRLKEIESRETGRRFFTTLPIYARIDGRCFSAFTRGMGKPETSLLDVMDEVTKYLVKETNACVGYTQSDEISLAWTAPERVFFEGKVQKMVSNLASLTTVRFAMLTLGRWPARLAQHRPPTFDARVFQVPDKDTAALCFLWRELDATKNAITMAACNLYSHKELLGKNGDEKQEMMFSKGVNFNDYPSRFKRGVYFARRKWLRTLSEEELAVIPERWRPSGPVERAGIVKLELPPLARVTNKAAVLFEGADPVLVANRERPRERA